MERCSREPHLKPASKNKYFVIYLPISAKFMYMPACVQHECTHLHKHAFISTQIDYLASASLYIHALISREMHNKHTSKTSTNTQTYASTPFVDVLRGISTIQ